MNGSAVGSDEAELLRRYVQERSQEAFAALVGRSIDLVYASARRQMRGDATAAEDVTQAVFIVLAQKAATIKTDRPLTAWLLQVTRYAAANARRAASQRERHERAAAAEHPMRSTHEREPEGDLHEMMPLLDEGLAALRASDRDTLVLRFFDRKSAREVAAALNISEDAAEKRITRAVERLRSFFRRRGVTMTLAALSATLATQTSQAAPAALKAAAVASPSVIAAGASTTTAAGAAASIAKGTVISMAMAKTKLAAVTMILLLLIGGGGVALVSHLHSSSVPRRVAVTTAPAAASLPALIVPPDAPPPAPMVARFSSGVAFQLIGITDTPGEPTRWWAADGTPMRAPSPLPSRTSSLTPGEHPYQFALLLTEPTDGRAKADLNWSATLDGPRVASTYLTDLERYPTTRPGGGHEVNFVFTTTAPPAQTNLLLRVGVAQWTERFHIDLTAAGGATRPTTAPTTAPTGTGPATQPSFTLVSIADNKSGQAEAVVRFSKEQDRRRGYMNDMIVLYDATGTWHLHEGVRERRDGTAVYRFDIPLKQAVALEYKYRPWETWEISNVSLRPGEKTTPSLRQVPPRTAP